ncbi:MAG: hypothetical protein EZS28_019048 [Streblomastix strix]|uniref:Uncharacterized protein n=1 Tax=Streblomastix strix TaxID=222440 RepID=A0A5J4VS81_9EUKA|nr:MAG: hypothetical protein EZS28_019048 [Streblomastix strix]
MFAKPFVTHILSNKTYKYLLANNLTHLFKPTRYYITYDIETSEKKVNEKFGDSSQVTATLIPYAVASTVKLANGIHSFYYDIRTENFLDKRLEQIFEEAKQVMKDNKYIDETIPKYYEVPVIGFNSAKFEASVLFKILKSKDWIILKMLQNIFGNGLCKKGRFPHEFINTNNCMNELNKSEPFPMKAFDNKLRNKKLSEDKYKEYLFEANQFVNRWDYLKHYNILDARVLIEPIDYLIELMFKYKVNMLANISMSQCANAIKYSMAYNDFDINGDYNCESSDKSIEITQNYWRAKVDNYIEQDNEKNKDSSNNVTIDDYSYFKELSKNQRCHMCNARFTWKNRPKLDRIDNKIGYSKNNVLPCCLYYNEFMNLRQQAKDAKNEELGQFCKLILNSAFVGDALNSEKYSNTRLLSANKTFVQHMMQGFINSTELNDDFYAVQVDKESCRCNTSYNMSMMHFTQGDTDSLTWAISGNPNRGPEQLFEKVIKDKGFFDTYKDCVFSENGKKQILHIGVEKQGYDVTLIDGEKRDNGINDENDAIDALEQLHIDWHAILKTIWEAAIKYACESKICH